MCGGEVGRTTKGGVEVKKDPEPKPFRILVQQSKNNNNRFNTYLAGRISRIRLALI